MIDEEKQKLDDFLEDLYLHNLCSWENLYAKDVATYDVSSKFSALNAKELNLIRDGLITIGGEASAGKTSFLTELAFDILKNNESTCFIFFSFDDSAKTTVNRILTQQYNHNFFQGALSEDELTHKLSDSAHPAHPFKRCCIIPGEILDGATCEGIIESVKTKTNCNRVIIAIDYLQIMRVDGGERREALNRLLLSLKEMQKKLADCEPDAGCILFVLSQFSRGSDANTFRYRETSEIENVSDVCLDLTTDSTGAISINVAKNKIGKRNVKFKTSIDALFRFEELTTDANYQLKINKLADNLL